MKMSKIAVVYWSGTGNTEAMANAVLEGARRAGNEVALFTADQFSGAQVKEYDAIAFGCPAMGAEELEDGEFEPMFADCELSGKRIGLFGSYGWGDGQWMRDWEARCQGLRALSQTTRQAIRKPPPARPWVLLCNIGAIYCPSVRLKCQAEGQFFVAFYISPLRSAGNGL